MNAISRRTFIAAGAGALMTLGVRSVPALGATRSRSWGLAAEGSFEPEPYAVIVNYAIDSFVDEQLYLQIADQDTSSGFYLWIPLEEPVGEHLFRCGGYDVPDAGDYLISIVTADGRKHPFSPVVGITVDEFPGSVGED